MERRLMSYVKFNPEKSEMLAVAIKHNGNVQAIARHYNINQDTMYQYFKRDPEGKEIIDMVRGLNTETDLDLAEHVHRYNMANYKTNPGLAQRAAEKVIDKKGHLRGWIAPDNKDLAQYTDEDIKKLDNFITVIRKHQSKSDLNKAESNISKEQ